MADQHNVVAVLADLHFQAGDPLVTLCIEPIALLDARSGRPTAFQPGLPMWRAGIFETVADQYFWHHFAITTLALNLIQ
jgi:hypothetical protein